MTRRKLLFLLLALVCAGCVHRAKWLHGKWVFDRERTQQMLAQRSERAPEEPNIIEGLKDLAAGLMVSPLIASFEGTQVEFTNKEMIVTDRSGNGQASAFEVLETPDGDTIRLKHADGDVVTYHREGDHFWRGAAGSSDLRVYFRRLK